ncbi:MAG: ABC transporter permease [Thermomicrobiales bacterium]|nr:ABC transporter permease [Thermomicrobiales bacterium]
MLASLIIIVFFVTRMVGDPVRLMLHPNATDEQIQTVRAKYGLDDPLLVQFGHFLSGLPRGDFGDSMWQRAPALEIVLNRLPATLYLAGVTMAIAFPIAVALGIISAVWPRSLADRIVTVLSLAGLSIADFWLALMMILFFAEGLGWFPTSGFGGAKFVVLPALTLAARPLGRISQIQRTAMLDELANGYVTTARAKGLSERVVVLFHTLKNASIPTVTMAGHEVASLLNGAIVIEVIFGWPGIGSLLIQAIERRDLTIVVAATVVIAALVITVNFVVDLIYGWADPRVRFG